MPYCIQYDRTVYKVCRTVFKVCRTVFKVRRTQIGMPYFLISMPYKKRYGVLFVSYLFILYDTVRRGMKRTTYRIKYGPYY